MNQQKKAAPREPEFHLNEFYDTLLRVRRDEPRRYEREVSAGTRRHVELYEERKAQAAAVVRARAA